jgi:lactate dehydrogenase-like 2-hydroxyacid dehydrogenase
MNHPLIIVTHNLPDSWLAGLDEHGEVLIGPTTTEESGLSTALRRRLPEAGGLLSMLTVRVDESLLAAAPHLRVVSNMAVGVDNIDLAACTARGVPVGHTPGVLTEATADLTLALLLATARRLPEAGRDARAGRWTTWSPDGWLGADLHGATLGIVGLGKIGTAVAERARAFGLRLVYAGPNAKSDVEARLGIRRLPFAALLAESDFVTLHVPLSPETRHLIDEAALRRMKPGAILINVARGPVVDSLALYRALSTGRIAAAGLDVTDPEPLPPDHPLYTLDNCLILPHIGSATHATRRRMAELAVANVVAGIRGERLPYCANPAVYR